MSDEEKTVIIAEAGVNHNGDPELAKALVLAAADAGADYVKFQTFRSSLVVTDNAPKALYQKENTDSEESQLSMLQALELKESDYLFLQDEAKKSGIGFLSTPADRPSLEFLARLHLDYIKVSSADLDNIPFLEAIAATGIPVILSTGMAIMAEIDAAVSVMRKQKVPTVTILQCVTDYPAEFADSNLRVLSGFADAWPDCRIGFSDHSPGFALPVAAVALGARVIEKHFTLDNAMEGPDHAASLNPEMFKAMTTAIRQTEMALGDGVKKPTEREQGNMPVVRKSLTLARDVRAGARLSAEDILIRRPGTGMRPVEFDRVIGKRIVQNLPSGHVLQPEDIG